MTENNKNHAPVAASLNLDACPFCNGNDVEMHPRHWGFWAGRCADCEIQGPSKPTEEEAAEAWNHRTPPAEVSADTLPALTEAQMLSALASITHEVPARLPPGWAKFARAIEAKVRAPYAEQIKKLERELSDHKAARIAYASEFAPNADGEPDVGNIHANIRNLKRELAERKQASANPMCERKTDDIIQREGYRKTGYVLMKDDPEARICVSDQGAVSWFTRDQWNWLMHNRDHVEFNWPKPIAYIDARPAGTAPETRSIFEYKRIGEFTVQVTFRSARACGKFIEQIAAAPSLSTGTEESK